MNSPAHTVVDCPLCLGPGGFLLYQHALFRVIDAQDADYPGFLRLVWNSHVREFSQLSREHRLLCMDAVVLLEAFVLHTFKADKANVATLGNVVPHLHWHVIPRFTDDKHFPAPVWAQAPEGAVHSPRQHTIANTQAQWHAQLQQQLKLAFGG